MNKQGPARPAWWTGQGAGRSRFLGCSAVSPRPPAAAKHSTPRLPEPSAHTANPRRHCVPSHCLLASALRATNCSHLFALRSLSHHQLRPRGGKWLPPRECPGASGAMPGEVPAGRPVGSCPHRGLKSGVRKASPAVGLNGAGRVGNGLSLHVTWRQTTGGTWVSQGLLRRCWASEDGGAGLGGRDFAPLSRGMQAGRCKPQPGMVQEPRNAGHFPLTPWKPCPPGISWPCVPKGLRGCGPLELRRELRPLHKEAAPEHTQEPSCPASSPHQSATPLLC